MPARLRTLVLVGALAAGVAATNAAHPLQVPTAPAPGDKRAMAAPVQADARAKAVTRVAIAYALATTNWTTRERAAAWRRELALAAPAFRRALQRARPSGPQLQALRADGARSHATVVRTESACIAGERARVVVWLRERTSTRNGTLTGQTRNQVKLEQEPDGQWRVTAWTAVPGGGAR